MQRCNISSRPFLVRAWSSTEKKGGVAWHYTSQGQVEPFFLFFFFFFETTPQLQYQMLLLFRKLMAEVRKEGRQQFSGVECQLKCVCMSVVGLAGGWGLGNQVSLQAGRMTGNFNKLLAPSWQQLRPPAWPSHILLLSTLAAIPRPSQTGLKSQECN